MSDFQPIQKRMPPSLMAKFMEGVEDNPHDSNDWETAIEQRPQRLGLGADPKQKPASSMTNAERRVKNMVTKQGKEESSSDSEEVSRSKIGKRK